MVKQNSCTHRNIGGQSFDDDNDFSRDFSDHNLLMIHQYNKGLLIILIRIFARAMSFVSFLIDYVI